LNDTDSPMTGDQMTAQVTAAYTALAGRWDTVGAHWNQPVAARLVDLAGLAPAMRVLDVGCGAGAATIRAARAVTPGGQVTGIDIAEPMLQRTAQAATAAGLGNITVQAADATSPPLAPASFDAVIASLVVYLLPRPAAALGRWRALLHPGGILAFSWVLAEDPAWEPVFAAVDAFLPEGQQGWNGFWRHRPWTSVTSAEALLPPAGFGVVVTTAEPVTTRYASPAHWWESSWTQAPALIWRHIRPGRRDAARAAAFAVLAPLAAHDGMLARVRTTCYTTARAMPCSPGRAG
jgi:ubiquinone/menaquinone biosynthesis C-methylase UbiE